MKVGMIGCGVISRQYLASFDQLPDVQLVAVADLDRARAEAAAEGREGVRALSVDELIVDAEVDTVLNLTIPAAHADVDLRAIAAGKNVYSEKPFAVTTEEGQRVLAAAAAAGVVVGSAPDTVLGTGTQTARSAIDDGTIGTPIAAMATMVTPGHERWHPQPDFYYVPGGGPLLDMGPYYIHALVTLLGPVSAVIGASSRLRSERTIGSGPREGETIPVSTDTHVTGVLVHESGVLSTLVMSFDAVATTIHPIEIHGTGGTLAVPDPNRFDGDVEVRRLGGDAWETLPVAAGYVEASRGIGLQDMAVRGSELRAGGALGQHVLEVMNAVLESSRSGSREEITSTVRRPAAVALDDVRITV
ncbi:oxidoreductase [Brachybacterium sp. P6-10-X1]|uniref:Gfo/Idh/MocA family protein n=1 Tax=Brachybacterium sp. P6-10-X1 TaxID=1903186 RepID=UPI000971B22E|nr:Gfo/Idh/MocA family oxidoreductase [Brachybacterium sp. P6-10-X1]APX33669.1 oxidoreductase [Brachybacterium sp. P6-10-X1]